jgi:hypothetical protein
VLEDAESVETIRGKTPNAGRGRSRGRSARVRIAFALGLALLISEGADAALCESCFAVVVMPDTQDYVRDAYQPAGAAHLELISRFICKNRRNWYEESTKKRMRIAMVLHLGDIVQSSNDEVEWQRAEVPFDRFDQCGMPYLVVPGNHDIDGGAYWRSATLFNKYFGPDRWEPYRCSDPKDCDWEAGQWFIGEGNSIPAHSRNNADGLPGPEYDEPGRHRAAVIRTPNGQRWLFMGLDLAFDFPPAAHPEERDHARWVKRTMRDYKGVHTIVIHHALLNNIGQFRPLSYDSDSYSNTVSLWDELVAPFPQVLMTLNGHHLGIRENEWLIPRPEGEDVLAVFRNYQSNDSSYGDGGRPLEKDGWTPIIVFDPEDGEIRIRSSRIEDLEDDGTHDGVPEYPRWVEKDFDSRPEQVFPYAFPDTRPAVLDNCPLVDNPDQIDPDGDGLGEGCTPIPTVGGGGTIALLAIFLVATTLPLVRRAGRG